MPVRTIVFAIVPNAIGEIPRLGAAYTAVPIHDHLHLKRRRICRTTGAPHHRGSWTPPRTLCGAGPLVSDRRFIMRRASALCAAIGIAVAATAAVSPAQAGYYVIRWDNT